jgi:hypothetical protein
VTVALPVVKPDPDGTSSACSPATCGTRSRAERWVERHPGGQRTQASTAASGRGTHPRSAGHLHQRASVAQLATRACADEPAKLSVDRSTPLRGLLAEGVERGGFPLGRDDLLHPADAERSDQFVLQIGGAHEEPELLHARSVQVLAQSSGLEMSAEQRLLIGIAQPGRTCCGVATSQTAQEVTDVRCFPSGRTATPQRRVSARAELRASRRPRGHCPSSASCPTSSTP